jgi:uncharacterized repeat protein (TIGR03803 family)
MNRNRYSRAARRWLGVFTLLLMLASAASAEWKEKVLYSFQGGNDGAFPGGGVVFDKQGNLYGATQQGGGTNCSPMAACGTVYQLAPPKKLGDPWTETILHLFQGKQHNDGEFPSGGVIADALGNIYGTSSYGGTGDCVLLGIKGGCGTVFELSPPPTKGGKWTYTILYSFKGGKDGYLPFGDLVFDGAGNLYGATYFGGGKGTTCNPYYQYCGTAFELSPPKIKGGKWTEKVLYSFKGVAVGAQFGDGANPTGDLVLDGTGAIFGTTSIGGYNCPRFQGVGCGTAFELKPPTKTGGAWTERILHRFTDGNDGAGPNGGLIFDAKGSLYGAAGGGGSQGSGVVFRLRQAKEGGRWIETMLYSFQAGSDGGDPQGLVFDSLGNLYCSSGPIVRLKPPKQKGGSWTLDVLYKFKGSPDGRNPLELIFGAGGALYGTTLYGGTGQSCQGGCGTVFEAFPWSSSPAK